MSNAPPLHEILIASARAVCGVRSGRSLTDLVATVPAPLRPGVQSVTYLTMRRLGLANVLKAALLRKAPDEPLLDALIAVCLALLSDESHVPFAEHTVVDEAVKAAERTAPLRRFKPVVNAVLRSFLRERATRLAAVAGNPEAQWNHPSWWIEAIRQAWPHEWEDVLRASNAHPSMTLRVNIARASVEEVMLQMSAAGAEPVHLGRSAIRLGRPAPVQSLPGFAQGLWSVQDDGAQLAAPLLIQDCLDAGSPWLAQGRTLQVLDACSAPGGKACHILELCAQGGLAVALTALDLEASRLARVRENLQRLNLFARTAKGDAERPDTWWDGTRFDRILVDAPCSASGIVRRHPDIRWLRRADDVAALATTQARILDALWPLLNPNGKLLFVTCSILPREGELQAQAFLGRQRDARRLPAPGQLLPVAGPGVDHDGFFYALFERD